ncbi:hypothetical protein [Mangrovibacterium marinum]|uniref:Uncharacterized protein n=1 Tax=Mangrovibacterium marinum TaxID=1639118 RepID=A0A2T5C2N2_9BACT|nr:hypothetical protein [Mangrovibacterium marinum]PTN08942.1 hypothetical protein C8N47_10639 [Mangrovibacterium marinum]
MRDLPNIKPGNVDVFLNREDIILDTIAQIMKDFGLFGVEIEYSGSIDDAYEKLHRQLVDQIDRLMHSNSDLLMSILYQVDISQRDIDQTANEFPRYNQIEVIAHQIIFRDLKKVLFRRYFSSR